MPRRAGKAASRRARQRPPKRPVVPGAPPPTPAAEMPVPPVGTPDAREAASLDPPRRTSPAPLATGSSNLTERERAEYHYVERDLRNIGILTVVMAVMLLVAWFAFTSLGLVS